MRNVYEVLQEKESAVRRVAREIEMLRLVAPLLTDDDTPSQDVPNHDVISHDVISHDAPRQDEHRIAYNPPPKEEESTDYFPTSDPNNEDGEDQDDANSVPGQKISGRLKRLVKPFVSLVAG